MDSISKYKMQNCITFRIKLLLWAWEKHKSEWKSLMNMST